MFTIITLCRDVYMDDYGNDAISLPYLSDDQLHLFNTKEEAYEAAKQSAEEELESLICDDDDEEKGNLSFNIPEDSEYESKDCVKIYGYDEDDNTYTVTVRHIREVL